jgi:hypothetical protein
MNIYYITNFQLYHFLTQSITIDNRLFSYRGCTEDIQGIPGECTETLPALSPHSAPYFHPLKFGSEPT